jgi:hypothetical protein
MPRVYIETTIPSFYFSSRSSAKAVAWKKQTRHWWDHHRFRYELCTSEAELKELRAAPPPQAKPRLELLESLPMLEIDENIRRIAEAYVEHQLMPRDNGLDSVHVALASRHAVDFVLTWNCAHIANANKTKHLSVINSRLGLFVPTMATPYTLI